MKAKELGGWVLFLQYMFYWVYFVANNSNNLVYLSLSGIIAMIPVFIIWWCRKNE